MASTTANRVTALLARLRASLDARGFIVDDAVRARIVAAHEDRGMEPDARPRIVFAPPATPDRIRALAEVCRMTLNVALPADYVAFLEANDGMCLLDYGDRADHDDIVLDDVSFDDDALMSTADIVAFLNASRVEITHQDGTIEVTAVGRAPRDEDGSENVRFVPFYALGGVGYHAIAFSADAIPVISIVDVDHERMWTSEGHDALATTFVDWLDAFLKSGLEPFATSRLLRGE